MFTIVEGELYAWKRDRLGDPRDIDPVLADLLFVIARLGPDLPFEEGSTVVRTLASRPILRDDGEVIKLVVRFVARETSGEVELLDLLTKAAHAEA